jgi:hypothetical protein
MAYSSRAPNIGPYLQALGLAMKVYQRRNTLAYLWRAWETTKTRLTPGAKVIKQYHSKLLW